jgi:hypothetical protein
MRDAGLRLARVKLTKEDHRIIRLALMTVRAGAYGLNYPHSVDEINDVLGRLKISGTHDQG